MISFVVHPRAQGYSRATQFPERPCLDSQVPLLLEAPVGAPAEDDVIVTSRA